MIDQDDWADVHKRDAEDAGRNRMLITAARKILMYCEFDWLAEQTAAIEILMREGPMSQPDACQTLEYLDWEDSLAKRT